MYEDKTVLCAVSAYEQKYYLNPDFAALPEQIQKELKIMCALLVEDVGGILTLYFAEDGTLLMDMAAREDDFLFDEIGSRLKIRQIQEEKRELLRSLELFYKLFFLGEDLE